MRRALLAVFVLAVALQWAVPLASIREREKILREGDVIKIPCRAPDPYDPLRGRYLAIEPLETLLPEQFGIDFKRKQPVFALLQLGADGLHHVQGLQASEPPSASNTTKLYIPVTVSRYFGKPNQTRIQWPISRFYVNENMAPAADEWLRKNTRHSKTVVAEARLLRGQVVLSDISLDGKSFRESLKENGP